MDIKRLSSGWNKLYDSIHKLKSVEYIDSYGNEHKYLLHDNIKDLDLLYELKQTGKITDEGWDIFERIRKNYAEAEKLEKEKQDANAIFYLIDKDVDTILEKINSNYLNPMPFY